MEALNEIKTWLGQSIKPVAGGSSLHQGGRQVLFKGNNQQAKQSAAQKLSHDAGKELLHVNLSQVVSKYIGETEKNLDAIFQKATNKNLVLFFDEADALFGKRTNVKDAHDKYANQEVSYLLQKMETYPGLAILSLGLKSNIDQAFLRRIRYVAEFV